MRKSGMKKAGGRKKHRPLSHLVSNFLLLTIYCLLLLSGCTKEENIYKENRVLMDTFTSITVVASSEKEAREAIDAGFAEIKKLEELLNYFSPDSEISTINEAAGESPVKVSKETLDIIEKAVDISEETNGAFDPTIAPVIKLWKFSKNSKDVSVPPRKDIEEALKHVDYRKVIINRAASEIYLKEKGMEIDLGGIAKGYAADKAVEVIRSRGIKSSLVAVAGDIMGVGFKNMQKTWNVGIQNPRSGSDSDKPWEDIFARLQLKDAAISTSGDYQRFFIKNGKRYHHIIDPNTGFPATSGLVSSTVIAPEGYIADSLSTAVFVLGIKEGMKLLESRNLYGVLVNDHKEVTVTRGLKDSVDIMRKDYKISDISE